MIGNVLDYVVSDLNRYLLTQQGLSKDERKAVLSYIVDPSGSMAPTEQNVVLATLVDLSPDTIAYGQRFEPNKAGGVTQSIDGNSLHLNLMVLFSAYFQADRARDSLNFLTLVIQFFQSKSVFDHQNSPGLPDSVEKLVFSMEPLDFHAQSHLWGILGAKYMPSVVYKVRMVSFFNNDKSEFTPPISVIGMNNDIKS